MQFFFLQDTEDIMLQTCIDFVSSVAVLFAVPGLSRPVEYCMHSVRGFLVFLTAVLFFSSSPSPDIGKCSYLLARIEYGKVISCIFPWFENSPPRDRQ